MQEALAGVDDVEAVLSRAGDHGVGVGRKADRLGYQVLKAGVSGQVSSRLSCAVCLAWTPTDNPSKPLDDLSPAGQRVLLGFGSSRTRPPLSCHDSQIDAVTRHRRRRGITFVGHARTSFASDHIATG